jgi:FAD/FMN-containing dehydrogenase
MPIIATEIGMSLSTDTLAALTALVGPEHTRSAAELSAHDPGVDPHNYGADLWLRPADRTELAAVLAYCNEARIAVVPHGGRTGLSGGAASTAGEIVVSLERFTALTVDPISRTAVVGAGVTLSVLAEAAARVGLSPGIDLGARESATIGGMVSTNAGGIAAFRHGTLRERVLGLEAVLADGRLLCELGQVIKRNEGLAVERLLIGAEGTLGVITEVALSLVPMDGLPATALVAVADLSQAAQLTALALASNGATPTALEVMSGNHAEAVCRSLGYRELLPLTRASYLMLIELCAPSAESADGALLALLEQAASAGVAEDAVVAQNDVQRQVFWRVREDWAVDRERPGGLWYDISVPLARAAEYIDALCARLAAYDPTLDVYLIGHLADGNLHVTVNAPHPISARYNEIAVIVTDGLQALGGSYSAEHGIGLEKKPMLERLVHPTKRLLMREIKALFDPNGILNPGKVIPT